MENIAHRIEEKERTVDIKLHEKVPFTKMMLSDRVRRGLARAGFVFPTVLQSSAIPLGKAGIDLLIQSKSGTGKTLIFCTTVLDAYDCSVRAPQALVLVPTREVAVQIESVLNQIGNFLPHFNAISVIGGTDVQNDRKRVQSARAIIGTPGRVLHLIRSSILNPEFLKLLVIDEADKFLDDPFRVTFEEINKSLVNKRQTIACSATLNTEIDIKLAKYMKNPLLLSTEKRTALLVGIKQFVLEIPEQQTRIMEMTSKLSTLKRIFSKVSFKQCLVFVNSQSRAESYSNLLEKDGWPCEFISGGQDQATRLDKFKRFREFKTRILISTDLMSRGVDSDNLNLVVNLEVPDDSTVYLHRIGRAGRFGSHGLAISLLSSDKDRIRFRKLMRSIGPGMTVLRYPEKNVFDLWNFSNLEVEEQEFGLFELSDPEADKENSPDGDVGPEVVPRQEALNNKLTVDKKPLSGNNNAKRTFTVSNSSIKVPSNNAVTLDDASSLTVDSEAAQSNKGEKIKDVDLVHLDVSMNKSVSDPLQSNSKLSSVNPPLALVLDSSSKDTIFKLDLFEDYEKVTEEVTSNLAKENCSPETSESIHIVASTSKTPQVLSDGLVSHQTERNSSEYPETKYLEDASGNCETYNCTNFNSHTLTQSSSSALGKYTSNIPSSATNNRNSNVIQTAGNASDSESETDEKTFHRKHLFDIASNSGNSDYNESSDSDASESERVASSGFGEKIPTEASSGIVTTSEYSESDSTCTYYSTSTSSDARSVEESSGSYISGDCFDKYDFEERNPDQQLEPNNSNLRYKFACDRWTHIYWQQIGHIHEYVNMAKYVKNINH